ncbi:MAG: rhodanese-like domain-containing protein [Burkholderiales bacterium]
MPANKIAPGLLKQKLHGSAELALLDVREAGQFGESHLLFATPLPYSQLELDIGALVPRKTAPVVLCDDGKLGIAERAAQRLQAMGYTAVSVLDGGNAAWAQAGYVLFAGVNVPSKTFGELVEHAYDTPRITAQELARMREAGEDFVLYDGRPLNEHQKMTIPGSTCCPNAELPYRIATMVKNPRTRIVVNCAGRTRSILGAQTLINFGVPNPVYALENGTQGWFLADMKLEYGADRRYPDIDPATLPAAQKAASRLIERFHLKTVTAAQAQAWLAETDRTTYLCDVRTPEEFKAGTLPGAVHAPGGQLIQATDQWVGVRNARIVVLDGGEHVRAPVVASWLHQLGCEVTILEGGVTAKLKGTPAAAPALPALPGLSVGELKAALAAGRCTVFDLGASMDFRKAHIPGSRWSIRSRLAADARGLSTPVVLVAADAALARLAATELLDAGIRDVKLLTGGLAAWMQAGYATEASPTQPSDADCIDFLFFTAERHNGNRAASQQYLDWETGLLAQLDAQDKATFKLPAH